MAIDALYPSAPANVPRDITRCDSAYRLRVLGMIGGLFLFLLIYLFFIALAGFVAYWLLVLPLPDIGGKAVLGFLLMKFGGAFAAILLWLFLLKGLFKGHEVEREAYVELQPKDYPELFAFIKKVYEEVGAPPPNHVYVSPEVNAALVYDTSLINLFIPPSKDLLIGLGLVNVLTLSEFKAVLAHEFGHFAQSSVGLGSYLYVANRVMTDVIESRDWLDEFVDEWAQQDLRLAFPAIALKGVLFFVRKILAGTYQSLNLLNLSLSRQMEYNADNFAVSVTGSDSLIHGLLRLEFADECMNDAAGSLNAAADHGLFSANLFFHQRQAADRLRRVKKDARAGIPPELPREAGQKVQVFQQVDDGIPDAYRTHPTGYMREQNAKRVYIRSPQDDRSPWLLFGKEAGPLRTKVTELFYRYELERTEDYQPKPAIEVQEFIKAEHAEATFDPKYHGLFDDRLLNPGDLQDLPSRPWPREEVAAFFASWPPAHLEKRMEAYQQRQAEFQLLDGLKSGEKSLKGNTFTFRNEQCSMKDVHRLHRIVDKELTDEIEALHRIDRDMFVAHWSLACELDGGARDTPLETELMARYRFHMHVQSHLQKLLGEQARLNGILDMLSADQEFSEDGFKEVKAALTDVYQGLTGILDAARYCKTPALTNVPAGETLYSLIVDRGDQAMPLMPYNTITGEWLEKMMNRLEAVLGRLKRVHFKSLGSLLAFQESLAAEANAGPTSPPTPEAAAPRAGTSPNPAPPATRSR
jgi:Zn-dependent protease with chaperone function